MTCTRRGGKRHQHISLLDRLILHGLPDDVWITGGFLHRRNWALPVPYYSLKVRSLMMWDPMVTYRERKEYA